MKVLIEKELVEACLATIKGKHDEASERLHNHPLDLSDTFNVEYYGGLIDRVEEALNDSQTDN